MAMRRTHLTSHSQHDRHYHTQPPACLRPTKSSQSQSVSAPESEGRKKSTERERRHGEALTLQFFSLPLCWTENWSRSFQQKKTIRERFWTIKPGQYGRVSTDLHTCVQPQPHTSAWWSSTMVSKASTLLLKWEWIPILEESVLFSIDRSPPNQERASEVSERSRSAALIGKYGVRWGNQTAENHPSIHSAKLLLLWRKILFRYYYVDTHKTGLHTCARSGLCRFVFSTGRSSRSYSHTITRWHTNTPAVIREKIGEYGEGFQCILEVGIGAWAFRSWLGGIVGKTYVRVIGHNFNDSYSGSQAIIPIYLF